MNDCNQISVWFLALVLMGSTLWAYFLGLAHGADDVYGDIEYMGHIKKEEMKRARELLKEKK